MFTINFPTVYYQLSFPNFPVYYQLTYAFEESKYTTSVCLLPSKPLYQSFREVRAAVPTDLPFRIKEVPYRAV